MIPVVSSNNIESLMEYGLGDIAGSLHGPQ